MYESKLFIKGKIYQWTNIKQNKNAGIKTYKMQTGSRIHIFNNEINQSVAQTSEGLRLRILKCLPEKKRESLQLFYVTRQTRQTEDSFMPL